MQHSKQYSTIRRRPYINWYTKHKEIIEIISVAVVAAAIVLMICTWYNRAYAENYQQVHKCIETYKAITPRRFIHFGRISEIIS